VGAERGGNFMRFSKSNRRARLTDDSSQLSATSTTHLLPRCLGQNARLRQGRREGSNHDAVSESRHTICGARADMLRRLASYGTFTLALGFGLARLRRLSSTLR
jgi:hypothetical protein